MEKARRYLVSGSVQGVGFRFFVERTARQLGLSGYVMNLPDGRVEVFAMGTAPQLEELKRYLERGPRLARVKRVLEEETEPEESYRGEFKVEFGGGYW